MEEQTSALAGSPASLSGKERVMRCRVLLAAAGLILATGLVNAQESTTGSIAGRVVDVQNLAVPGASVTIVTPQGRRSFTTD